MASISRMKRGSPYYYDEDRMLLKEKDPEFEDPRVERVKRENAEDHMMRKQDEDDWYGSIEGQLFGGQNPNGKGYLNPAGHGYLRPPNVRGGFVQALIPLAASFLPSILEGIFGSGVNGRRRMDIPLKGDASTASQFYRNMFDSIAEHTSPEIAEKKLSMLMGGKGMLKSVLRKKVGGGNREGVLKLGHLLMPAVLGHLQAAKMGNGVSEMIKHVENMPEMNEPVGGSIGSMLGKLWNGVKGVIGKITGNQKVRDIASKTFDKATEAVANKLPDLAERGINKLSDYYAKKLDKRDPEELTEDDYENMRGKLSEKEKKDRMEELYEREQRRKPKRPTRYEDDEPRRSSRYEEEDELPSGRSDSRLRKEKVRERNRAIVPVDDDEQRKIVGRHPFTGAPIYGDGKKKASGGNWHISLQQY